MGVTKFYGAIAALEGVDFEFTPGLNAIVGDNGAGKSTLMKILSGVVRPDAGTIAINGEPVELKTALDARTAGIESLYQDLALAPTMSICDNIFLGREITKSYLGVRVLDRRAMMAVARAALGEIRISMPDPGAAVRTLSGGQRQSVAVARALHFGARVLLLDEPTAALGPRETAAFFDILRAAVAQDGTVVMVGHNLPQVLQMASRIIVMRAGQVVARFRPEETSVEKLTGFMVGSAS
ncbi:MAG: ATP-binding cassette domain-containing protein [Candidatus Dormibacteria bacterium]